MKIHEYNEMMSYLTRPAMKTGGQVIGKPGGLVEPGVTNYGAEMILQAPKIGSQIVKAGNYLKNLLASRKAYTGAEKVGVSTLKTDYTAEKEFAKKFQEYANNFFAGNWSAASKSIGEDRGKIRGIFQTLSAKRSPKKGTYGKSYGELATGAKTTPTIDISLGTKSFKDITTDLKYNPEILTEKVKRLVKQGKVSEKNFYNSKDLANILGIDSTIKRHVDSLTTILKQNNVLSRNISPTIKEYNLADVSKKIKDWSSTKKVKGDAKAASERIAIEKEWDLPLTRFLDNLKERTRTLSKDTDIFVRNAVEDVGHAQSIKTVSKYPNLFKNSNVKSMQTLTYQDPQVNREIFQNQGFQGKYDTIFKELNKLVNKKVTKENIEDLNLIRNKLKENHANLIKRIKTEAKDNSYFKGQEKRIPEVKLSKLKIGDTFKSENIFADMSTVDSYYQVGQISKINPTAKKFSDLTPKQIEWYKQVIKNQSIDNLEKFYKQVGYSADEIEELKDALETGTGFKKGLNEGGRVGLAEGTSLWGKTKSVGGTTLRSLERSTGPWFAPLVGLHTAITGEVPDMTKSENLLLPAFWNQIMKKYKWEDKSTDPIKRRIKNFLKRGTIPTKLMPFISKISGYALGPAELNQAIKAGPAKEERIAEVARDKGWDVDETLNMYRMTYDQPEFSRDFFYKKMFGKMPDLSTIQDVIKSPEYKERKKYFTNAAIDQYWENKETDPIKLRTLGPDVMRGSVVDKYNQGGRVGFGEGSKPKSPGRRVFLKGITALAALPIVGRYFKLGKVLERGSTYMGPAIEKVKGMPEWFPGLVKKLWNEGEDVTKTMATGERQIIKRGTLEGGDDIDLVYQIDTGDVRIDVTPKIGKHETKSGAYNKEYELYYQKGLADETTKGKKPPDEFAVSELEPRQMGPDDIELDGTITTVDDAMSDLTELEAFAKSKSTKQIHKKKGTKPKDVSPEYDPPDYDWDDFD